MEVVAAAAAASIERNDRESGCCKTFFIMIFVSCRRPFVYAFEANMCVCVCVLQCIVYLTGGRPRPRCGHMGIVVTFSLANLRFINCENIENT